MRRGRVGPTPFKVKRSLGVLRGHSVYWNVRQGTLGTLSLDFAFSGPLKALRPPFSERVQPTPPPRLETWRLSAVKWHVKKHYVSGLKPWQKTTGYAAPDPRPQNIPRSRKPMSSRFCLTSPSGSGRSLRVFPICPWVCPNFPIHVCQTEGPGATGAILGTCPYTLNGVLGDKREIFPTLLNYLFLGLKHADVTHTHTYGLIRPVMWYHAHS